MSTSRSFFAIALSALCACGSGTTDGSGGATSGGTTSGGTTSGGTTSGGPTSGGSAGSVTSGGTSSSGAGTAGASTSGGATAQAGTSAGGASGGGAGIAGSGGTTSNSACTRELLDAVAESYVAALVAGDPTKMTLANGATNVENKVTVPIADGILKTPLPVAFRRHLLDVEQCESFSEIIITEGGHPYVLGAHLVVVEGAIEALDVLVTDEGDWLFDADAYARHSKAEDWSILPEEQRISREQLIAAANAYFDLFSDKTVVVPWGTPCDRMEGGQAYTNGSCDVGVPEGITFANKHFVVDIPMGTSVGLVRFGGPNGLPDSHMFRVPSGKIRYVHTLTVCPAAGCTG